MQLLNVYITIVLWEVSDSSDSTSTICVEKEEQLWVIYKWNVFRTYERHCILERK